jgi:hypothetical protein
MRPAALLVASGALLGAGGCENAGQGAVSGGAIGALGGLAIGSLTGSAGEGAAIGAVGGAIVGGVIGDQNRRAEASAGDPVRRVILGVRSQRRASRQRTTSMNDKTMMRRAFASAALVVAAAVPGCKTGPLHGTYARPTTVSPIDASEYSDQHDLDRMALTRFIGAWDFTGWHNPPDGERRETAGIAAGVVEHRNFVLLDIANLTEEGETVELGSGSILFAVEPEVGLVVTTWSEASPAVHRYRGMVQADGSRFAFGGVKVGETGERVDVVAQFETDDRFVMRFYRGSGDSAEIVAEYAFSRAD